MNKKYLAVPEAVEQLREIKAGQIGEYQEHLIHACADALETFYEIIMETIEDAEEWLDEYEPPELH